jgi:hypothetical protein
MYSIAPSMYTFTCKICTYIRNTLLAIFCGMVAMGESAGRARAAAQLQSMGYHKEAKALMLGLPIEEADDL